MPSRYSGDVKDVVPERLQSDSDPITTLDTAARLMERISGIQEVKGSIYFGSTR